MRDVVITGIGMVTPLGLNVSQTWDSLIEGKNGVHRIQRFDPAGYPVRFAAEVPDSHWKAFPFLPLEQKSYSN